MIVALLPRIVGDLTGHHASQLLTIVGQIFGVRDVLETAGQELVSFIAGDLRQATVDAEKAPVDGHVGDADRRVFECGTEERLALDKCGQVWRQVIAGGARLAGFI